MRYWLLALAIAGAACGGGQGTPFCNEPAPVLANLDISPDNADVGSHGGQVAVSITWEVLNPNAEGPLSTVIVTDSNGQMVPGEMLDYYSHSTIRSISTTTAEQYTIEVQNLGLCTIYSNILRGVFEIVEAANAQSKYSVITGTILGSPTFDVTQIDLSTVTYGFDKDQSTVDAHYQDVNGDGFLDCTFEIDQSDIDIGCCESGFILHGRTWLGTAFAASLQIDQEQTSAYDR